MSSREIDRRRLELGIYDYLSEARMATPPQMINDLGMEGKAGIGYAGNPNIRFVEGISQPGAKALVNLLKNGLVHAEIVSPILQFIDRSIYSHQPATTRQINDMLRSWGSLPWVEKPIWVPIVFMPDNVTMDDLIGEPITPEKLIASLDSADAAHRKREDFRRLEREIVIEPSLVNEAGGGGSDE